MTPAAEYPGLPLSYTPPLRYSARMAQKHRKSTASTAHIARAAHLLKRPSGVFPQDRVNCVNLT